MKILCLGRLPQDVEDKLTALGSVRFIDRSTALPEDELIKALSEIDLLLTEPQDVVSEKVIAASQLKMIAQRAVGYDNLDIKALSAANILVSNTPGVLDNATADLAFALLLACTRRIVEADQYVRAGQWSGFENDLMLGTEISGKTIGIVGMGRIGYAMAKRAHGFGMKIIYSRSGDETKSIGSTKEITTDAKDEKLSKELGASRVSLRDLLEQSQFISLHCPLNATTTKLIGEKEFALMQQDCIFVNTARGRIVDEEALVKAITSKKLKAAGIDVFFNEPAVPTQLLAAPNVVLAPHIGSATNETRHAMADLAVTGAVKAFAGIEPTNLVNKELFGSWKSKVCLS
jgi:glyoxylate reductase